MIVAHEMGFEARIEKLDCAAHPVKRDQTIVAHNPLGQVPTLLLEDGMVLADSRVICEYLNDQGGGDIFPRGGAARWRALADQSLADGMLAGALLARYETAARPPEKEWPEWSSGNLDKSRSGLAAIEQRTDELLHRFDIGTIAIACAINYLDLRFPDLGWRDSFPSTAAWIAEFEKRPSLAATRLS